MSLSQASRLTIGGAVAPALRRRTGSARRITIVDRQGAPVRVCDDVEIAKGVLARAKIEFSVVPNQRPEYVFCVACGAVVKVDRPTGRLPTRCRSACVSETRADALRCVDNIKAVVEKAVCAVDSSDSVGFYGAIGEAATRALPRALIDGIVSYQKCRDREALDRIVELCCAAAYRRIGRPST